MEFSLKDITDNALTDVINNLNSKFDGIIKKAFDDKFDDFKGEIQNHLVEWKNTIKDTIDVQYNSTIYTIIDNIKENLIIIQQSVIIIPFPECKIQLLIF